MNNKYKVGIIRVIDIYAAIFLFSILLLFFVAVIKFGKQDELRALPVVSLKQNSFFCWTETCRQEQTQITEQTAND